MIDLKDVKKDGKLSLMEYEQTCPGHVLIIDTPPLVYLSRVGNLDLSAARHNLFFKNVF